MRRTGNDNINTAFYWNNIYSTADKRREYEQDAILTGDRAWVDGRIIIPSKRIVTMAEQVEGTLFLDLGCGVGTLIGMIQKTNPNAEVWGADISRNAIEYCHTTYPSAKCFQQFIGALDKIPQDYFDTVLSGEVLEHLENPADLFTDAYKCLKTGGKFVLSTPNDTKVRSDEHVWFFTKDDITNLYTDNGFTPPTFIELPDMEKEVVIVAYGYKL